MRIPKTKKISKNRLDFIVFKSFLYLSLRYSKVFLEKLSSKGQGIENNTLNSRLKPYENLFSTLISIRIASSLYLGRKYSKRIFQIDLI